MSFERPLLKQSSPKAHPMADPLRPRHDQKADRAAVGPRALAAAGADFARGVGARVRRGRARRGITRRRLAAESGISERYLAQIESGRGNPSVIVLKSIARAIELPIADLLPRESERDAALARLIDLLGRLPAPELAAMATTIERRLHGSAGGERARRIALIGLRGAGKSTLGRMLAEDLGFPFVELDRLVEQEYGASVSLLIEMSGVSTFRRYERTCLEKIIADRDAVVIATAGGIVSNPQTYALLLRRTHAIWLKARPQEHMARVMAQGDFRPMAENREAMADLVAILEARGADYAQAQATLDTAGKKVEMSFADLLSIVEPLLRHPEVRGRSPSLEG